MTGFSGPKRGLLILIGGIALTGEAGARLAVVPGFADRLSREPYAAASPIDGRASSALAMVARAAPVQRQPARWALARALAKEARWAEAGAVLRVMEEDEPALIASDRFAIERARVALALRRDGEVVALLERPSLGRSPDACALRAVALARMAMFDAALRSVACAGSERLGRDRALLAAAVDGALAMGRWKAAAGWLGAWNRADPGPAEAVRRGRFLLAMGQAGAAERAFARGLTGDAGERAAVRLGLVQAKALAGRQKPDAAIEELARIALVWRGDSIERAALEERFRLASARGAIAPALESAAALMRYHALGPRLVPLAAEVTGLMERLVRPGSLIGLAEAAGLFWDYRDLAPAGGDGDRLALLMATRLQAEGLYARAADLVEYQMASRADDVTRTALSVRAARLRLLAGEAGRAVDLLHEAEGHLDPPDLAATRHALEAIALDQMGRHGEAEALLTDVPGGAGLVAELRWRRRDWKGVAEAGSRRLGGGRALDTVGEVVLLRQSIALAMTGDAPALAALARRYRGRIGDQGVARAFALLTGGRPDAEALSAALSALPEDSPAGEWGDLVAMAPDQSR